MKTELMRELFELKYPNAQVFNYNMQQRFEGFQAACNMFLPFVEILPDDAEPQDGDKCAFIEGWKRKILTRNGKYAIRQSDLIKQESK